VNVERATARLVTGGARCELDGVVIGCDSVMYQCIGIRVGAYDSPCHGGVRQGVRS